MKAMRDQMDSFLKVIKNPHVRNLLLVPEPRGLLIERKGLRHGIGISKEDLNNSKN